MNSRTNYPLGKPCNDGDRGGGDGQFCRVYGMAGMFGNRQRVALKSRSDHRKLAPWMFLFLALGYTGGLLSLLMQQPVMESPHFWTGSAVLVLLAVGSLISLTGFGGNKLALRGVHAYLGTTRTYGATRGFRFKIGPVYLEEEEEGKECKERNFAITYARVARNRVFYPNSRRLAFYSG